MLGAMDDQIAFVTIFPCFDAKDASWLRLRLIEIRHSPGSPELVHSISYPLRFRRLYGEASHIIGAIRYTVEVPIAGSAGSEVTPHLSIVIPAYNEEHRLASTLRRLHEYLSAQDYSSEIVVVSNGSTDDSAGLVRGMARDVPNLRVIDIPERGKGIASRTGALQSRGDIVFLCDADLSMPPQSLAKFLEAIERADVVAGSREAFGSRRFEEPWHRHVMGRVFNRLVKTIAVKGIEDTQCGFKAIRRQAAHDLFAEQRLNGFAFDVELLYLARKYGYRIEELGIEWHFNGDSRVRPGIDTLGMVKELLMIRMRDACGVYRACATSAAPGRGDIGG
jgi:dolichyl-phosphate beta-glucosyltransferase